MIAGFGTLAFGTFIPNVFFGMLTATILSTGLVADMVLLPALLLSVRPEAAAADDRGRDQRAARGMTGVTDVVLAIYSSCGGFCRR